MNFEENLDRLDKLVDNMESGELKLDAQIKAFEEGRALVKACKKELEEVRLRIDKVTKSGEIEELAQ